jgi:hypothetical protein
MVVTGIDTIAQKAGLCLKPERISGKENLKPMLRETPETEEI